jgi:hypothetical protein
MVTCNQRSLSCFKSPDPRATRLDCIASGSAPRDYGRRRSGCLMCGRAPSLPRHASSPRRLPPASKQRRINDLLTPLQRTLRSEARRDLDGVGWCKLHGEAATSGHRAGGPVQSNRSITLCAFTTDPTEAPLERLEIDDRQSDDRAEKHDWVNALEN